MYVCMYIYMYIYIYIYMFVYTYPREQTAAGVREIARLLRQT